MLQPEVFSKVPAAWVQQTKFKMLFFEAISHLLVGQAGGLVGDGTVNEGSMVTSLLHLRHAHNLFSEAASHARVFLADCPGLICAAAAYLTQTDTRINAAEAILFVGRAAAKNKKAYKRALQLAAKQYEHAALLPADKARAHPRRASLESGQNSGITPLVPYIWGQARVNAMAIDPLTGDMPDDAFTGLGAALHAGVAISARRTHFLHAKDYRGDWGALGIVLTGDGATRVESVAREGVAALAGFAQGMILAAVGVHSVLCESHAVVQALLDAMFYSQGWAEIEVLVPFKDFDAAEIFEQPDGVQGNSTGLAAAIDMGGGAAGSSSFTISTGGLHRGSLQGTSQHGASALGGPRGSSFKHLLISRRGAATTSAGAAPSVVTHSSAAASGAGVLITC